MRYKNLLFFISVAFSLNLAAQDSLYYPVDIVYVEATENYYVSNSAEGNGYILKLDADGNILEPFYTGLHYTGGMCIVDDILYVGDNYGIWDENQPSYIIGIDLASGNEVLNFLVASTNSYLDLMTTDNNGNLYIGNSTNGLNAGKVHKYNIATQELTNIVTQTTRPYGVSYDFINDRIIFVESGPNISFLRSVSPNGGTVTNIFYMQRRMNGVIMKETGDFFISSWGNDNEFGDESVYKANNALDWHTEISTGHNRPFGMCIGKDNHLAVCNWGSHSLSFIDLDPFGVNDITSAEGRYKVYPNPSSGKFHLSSLQDITSDFEIAIMNLSGIKVYENKIANQGMFTDQEIDISGLPAGTYIMVIRDDQTVSQLKLMIR